jgi:hypothetical protein
LFGYDNKSVPNSKLQQSKVGLNPLKSKKKKKKKEEEEEEEEGFMPK